MLFHNCQIATCMQVCSVLKMYSFGVLRDCGLIFAVFGEDTLLLVLHPRVWLPDDLGIAYLWNCMSLL